MSNFWNSLNRLSQDQLFAGGYLSPSVALEISRRRASKDASDKRCVPIKQTQWPRLATPH